VPMITVEYPNGALSQEQKDTLAEDMTHVLLEIEGGADTPDGRSIAWVRFREIAPTDWYIGGTTDKKYVAAAGKFLIELNVPEGSMNQARKSDAHRAINDAFLRVTGTTGEKSAGRSVWVQIFEWPEGHLATSGRTASLLGIAKLTGKPADHPRLAFSRAYFDAKDRWYDSHGFPQETAGRALVRY
jgi:phenylpyruvate tautomerase PptA (4-oxalocrotonate tautomerase family)